MQELKYDSCSNAYERDMVKYLYESLLKKVCFI